LELAARTGEPTTTAPIRLAQDSGNQAGFLVFVPMYGRSAPENAPKTPAQVAGFAVAVFSVADLVHQQFDQLKKQGIAVKLFDDSTSGQVMYSNTVDSKSAGVVPLNFANRQWLVAYSITPRFQSAISGMQSWLVLLGGLAFTMLTTAYLYRGWWQTQKIALANAALQEEVAVRQQAEAAAESANRAKSDFLASMSHEIRTPLNAILGYTQLMQRDRELSSEQQDSIRGISLSGHHLLGLINEILDLAKIEAGRMELNVANFDLEALGRGLAATFQPLCVQKRIAFRVVFAGGGNSFVRGDEGKLRQILINLLGNAVKFTAAGEVCLRCKNVGTDGWLFEVIDTGLGIAPEELEHIFKPFHQGGNSRNQEGTGLGLAIAQRQVELIGGRLEVQSERGLGSRFFFQVPLRPAELTEPELNVSVVGQLKPGYQVRALVVDDRRENCDILARMLSEVGCEVCVAASGGEALSLVREKSLDIVFLDLLLPDMEGIEVARRMRADGGAVGLKIVAHTAAALEQYREEARQAGCVDFLAKPIRSERVYECLRAHLGVEFDCAAPSPESEPPAVWDAGQLRLSNELYARLATAAELHSTTALKACLLELRQLGPDAGKLAEHIRYLMRSYDMDGILRLILRATIPTLSDTDVTQANGYTSPKNCSV
jgi:signal transduction histidine kinase/CheY-like chemotaxis protein